MPFSTREQDLLSRLLNENRNSIDGQRRIFSGERTGKITDNIIGILEAILKLLKRIDRSQRGVGGGERLPTNSKRYSPNPDAEYI